MNNVKYKNDNFIERESGVAFSLSAIAPYFVMLFATMISGFLDKNYQETTWYHYVAFAASQIAYLGILSFFIFRKKENPLKLFAVKKFHIKYLFLAVMISFGLLFGLGYLNNLFVGLLEKLGLSYNSLAVPSGNIGEVMFSLIIIAFLPAVCEECLFRGIILSGTSRFKTYQVILLNGLLFSLFHQNPAQTIYQFLVGCIYALLVIKSGSILTAVIMHFLNNAAIILLTYFFPQTNFYTVIMIVIGMVVLVLSLAYLIFFDKSKKTNEQTDPPKTKEFLFSAVAGILFCAVMWALTLVL